MDEGFLIVKFGVYILEFKMHCRVFLFHFLTVFSLVTKTGDTKTKYYYSEQNRSL